MDINVGDVVYILTGMDVTTGFFTQIVEDKVVDLVDGDNDKEMVFQKFGINQPVSRLGVDIYKSIIDAQNSEMYAFTSIV